MAKVKIKLTLREEPFEVDESELPGLRVQGLVAKGAKPVPVTVAKEPAAPGGQDDAGKPQN